jgi:hypothetical protein
LVCFFRASDEDTKASRQSPADSDGRNWQDGGRRFYDEEGDTVEECCALSKSARMT